MVLDACVLYPPSLRDFLLTLAALDAFEVRWSEPILEELRRNVVANHPEVDPDRFSNHTLAEMRRHFPEAMAVVSQAEIDRLDNDPKDRHVAAVGIVATADAIVTINVRDFRSHVLQEAGIAVLTPGELVGQILDAAPEVSRPCRESDCAPLDEPASLAGRGGQPHRHAPHDVRDNEPGGPSGPVTQTASRWSMGPAIHCRCGTRTRVDVARRSGCGSSRRQRALGLYWCFASQRGLTA